MSKNLFLNWAPYHLPAYGTLLGTELYQTFVMTKVCFKYLPMSSFTQLQKRLFPIYFKSQLLLVGLTAATHPQGLLGSFWKPESKYDIVALGVIGVMSALNATIYGPQTADVMMKRVHQETRDGRKFNEEEKSPEMKALNKKFSRAHAMSIHLNLVAIVATVWYGFKLGARLNFEG